MPRFLAERALLPGGWARNVLLEVAADGALEDVRPGADDPDATRVSGIVLPGIQNLHSHAFQRALAGQAERGSEHDDTFWSWRERMYAFLARLDPDDVEAVAAQLYVEMLEAGYTAVGEFHYLHRAADGSPYDDPAETSRRLLAAARRTGIGMTHLPAVYEAGGFGGSEPAPGQRRFLMDGEAALGLLDRLAPDLVDDPDRRAGLALHSLRAVRPGSVVPTVDALFAAYPGARVHVHVAEQRREVEACLAWSGARPVAWLLDHAPVDGRWCLVHATHVDESEVERLASSGAVAGLCPTTEANLGDGVFPLPRYLENGGALGVGSDSHVSVSPVEELRWLEYGQRLRSETRNVAAGGRDRSTGRVLFDAAVAGGEAALGRGAGSLEPGRRADWVVLDAEHPLLAGRDGDGVLDAWIFSGNVPAVREVVVGGRPVVRDGRHPAREAVARRYREVVRGLGAG